MGEVDMKTEEWGGFPKDFGGRVREAAKKFVQFDTLIALAVIRVLFWVWVVFAVVLGIALIPSAPLSGLGMIVLGPLVGRVAAEFLLVIFTLLVNLSRKLKPGAEEAGVEAGEEEPPPDDDARSAEPEGPAPDEDTGPLKPPSGPLPPVPVS